jgi:glycosyltransferase involved in cell wall biosynthesis
MLHDQPTINQVYSRIREIKPTAAGPLSVVIIAFNEEKNIGRCIDSVSAIADEIIVIDSFSSDRTVEIAARKGASITQTAFRGYIEQKNYALQLASNNFVLSLDADEALDEELVRSILEVKKAPPAKAFKMNRCTSYCGHFLRHGAWYPDRKIRLFDKRIAHWGGDNPHDKIILEKGNRAARLKGNILHFSFTTVEDHITQNNHFTTISASTLYAKGIRFKWHKMVFNPFWAFIYGYILRLGFLDGFYCFVVAVNASHYTFMKYLKLRQAYAGKEKNRIPPRKITSIQHDLK